MDSETQLKALKVDLGITTDAYDDRLLSRLASAKERLTAEGINLDENSTADNDLIIMYAAWLWRDRATGSPMPRMLTVARNNRLFGQKARVSAADTATTAGDSDQDSSADDTTGSSDDAGAAP